MGKFLFVCTGNTCRSPMAEAMFSSLLEERNLDIKVSSAGISAFQGQRASDNAIALMDEKGIDLRGHRSKQLSLEDVESDSIILTMTENHKDLIKAVAPEVKVYLLKEYAKLDEDDMDIPDPYGGDLEIYRKSLEAIEKALLNVVASIDQ